MRYTCYMPAVHLEVEKKYAADDGFDLPPLTDLVLGAGEGSPFSDGHMHSPRGKRRGSG